MLQIKKEDFKVHYNFNNLQQKRKKDTSRWMWYILFGCFLFQMLPYCVALNLTNVFVGSDWGLWTNNNPVFIGLTFTMGCLSAAFAGPAIAKMFGKNINMKLVYCLGVFVAMLGFVFSGLNSLFKVKSVAGACAILWIGNIISQAGVMIFSGLGVNNLISRWWPQERRGFALGLAFTGGSVGNIWMQQLVSALSKEFGNLVDNGDPFGTRYATYFVMGAIGLVGGVMVVLFTCKKPLAPVDYLAPTTTNTNVKEKLVECVNCTNQFKPNSVKKDELTAVSPLVTRKYPLYFVLGFGYLILQMGTVHASMNGLMISNALCVANPSWNYTNVMGTGGTIFGVCCLVGNFSGGILNDKLGPKKSIPLGGTVQCLAIFLLMYSIKTPALVYGYFALAGLSVYVYTSTPVFISGRLYGASQSNNHMSILGIFIAVGFAIVNSISGVLTGETTAANTHTMFGSTTNGNIQALGIFALSCMAFGTIVVTFCTTMILRRGIKGLAEYSPTKYSWIILFKHSFKININSLRIMLGSYDFRKDDKYQQKLKAIKVDTQKAQTLINKSDNQIKAKISKNKNKTDNKITKINAKLDATKTQQVDQEKQAIINKKADAKIAALKIKYNKFMEENKSNVNKNNEWKIFQKEYHFIEKFYHYANLKYLLQNKLDAKVTALGKKINVSNYVLNYNNQKLNEGIELLKEYYTNPTIHCNQLLTQRIDDKLEAKQQKIQAKAHHAQNKFNKLQIKKAKIKN